MNRGQPYPLGRARTLVARVQAGETRQRFALGHGYGYAAGNGPSNREFPPSALNPFRLLFDVALAASCERTSTGIDATAFLQIASFVAGLKWSLNSTRPIPDAPVSCSGASYVRPSTTGMPEKARLIAVGFCAPRSRIPFVDLEGDPRQACAEDGARTAVGNGPGPAGVRHPRVYRIPGTRQLAGRRSPPGASPSGPHRTT